MSDNFFYEPTIYSTALSYPGTEDSVLSELNTLIHCGHSVSVSYEHPYDLPDGTVVLQTLYRVVDLLNNEYCSMFTDRIVEMINNDRLRLVFSELWEAHFWMYFNDFQKFSVRTGIKLSKIIFLHSGENLHPIAHSLISMLLPEHQLQTYSIPWFAIDQRNRLLLEKPIRTPTGPKNKRVSCLNRNTRLHRTVIFSELFNESNVLSTFLEHVDRDFIVDAYQKFGLSASLKHAELASAETPREFDIAFSEYTGNPADLLNAVYSETDIDLINETFFNDQQMFFTEKVWRAIIHGRPFILASETGSLKVLQEKYGIETFAPFINEEYDNEPDHGKRLTMIVDEVRRISNLPDSEYQILVAELMQIAVRNSIKSLLTPFKTQRDNRKDIAATDSFIK